MARARKKKRAGDTFVRIPVTDGADLHVLSTGKHKSVTIRAFVSRHLDSGAAKSDILPGVLSRASSCFCRVA